MVSNTLDCKIAQPEGWEGEPLTEEETDFFEKEDIEPFDKCPGCEEYWIDIYRQYDKDAVTDGTYSFKKEGSICLCCRESDDSCPQGTIIIYDPNEGTAEKWVVAEYNDTCFSGPECLFPGELDLGRNDFTYDDIGGEESPIQFKYVRTGGWRGYYEPAPPDGWVRLHSDTILSYSQDARELKNFDIDIKDILWESGYKFAVCFGRTSNVFSTGYDIYVEATAKDLELIALIVKVSQLRIKYRNRLRFSITALTGKTDPEDFDEKDKLLVETYDRLKAGEDFEEIKEDIIEKARRLND